MKKLTLQMQLSLDGFVAGPNGEMDWMVWNWDDDLTRYVNELTAPVDCILLGRKLAEGFIPVWEQRLGNPETADSFARKMVETPKVVFSKTIEESQWKNTVIANGDIVEEVNRLKNKKDIIVYGGANFVSSLIKYGLIDEYHFFINPAALGSGLPIFKMLKEKKCLKLVKSSSFECGIIVLCYVPA